MDRTGSIVVRIDYRLRDTLAPVTPHDVVDVVRWELQPLIDEGDEREVPEATLSSIVVTGTTLTGVACLACPAVVAPLPGAVCPGCGMQRVDTAPRYGV